MGRLIFVTVCAFFGLLAGCASQLAHYDYEPGFAFSAWKTYAVQQSDKQTYQSLDGSRIDAAVRQQLQGRYAAVAPDQADVVFHYYVLAERKVDTSGVSFGFGLSGSNMGVGVSTGPSAKEKTEGQLVLEAVDRATNQVVWVAKAARNLQDSMNPTQREYLLQDLVQEMLANFPPQ